MKVSLIGSGNVATVLGKLLKVKGHIISEVAGRNITHTNLLANELYAKPVNDIKLLSGDADFYIIAVSDASIAGVASRLATGKGMVVHTSGAISINVLKKTSDKFGVLYPLQSLRKEISNIPPIPFFIDANNEVSGKNLHEFAVSISAFVQEADDEKRLKLHAAAVMVSNFTNYLYTLAEDYCTNEGINFMALVPLIKEVANRLSSFSPAHLQTGPAMRQDKFTIEKHLESLDNYPALKKIYRMLSESIIDFYKTK